MKKTALVLIFTIVLSMATSVVAIDDLNTTAEYLISTIDNPSVSMIGGEWTVIGVARSGASVLDGYFEKYCTNLLNYVNSKDGILHARKNTEYARVVLALTAIGKDPENFEGYNFVEPLLDYDKTLWQGINGPIWALIAIDSKGYGTEDIRQKYIDYILSKEKADGGWALAENQAEADADITAMVLIALSNYKDNGNVSDSIDRGVNALSKMQSDNGGYSAYDTETSESTAQVLTAISSLGITCNDQRFIKNGKTLVDNIYSYRHGDGSFSHTENSNLMATEQCFYALVAAKRLEENKTALFDMSDVDAVSETDGAGLTGKHKDISLCPVIYQGKTFSDITGHINQDAIEQLASRGIINGMGENVFAPDNTMTRAEFATITVKALGLPLKEENKFTDVTESDWFYTYVGTAFSYGIINGVSDHEFDPNGTITREQAYVMISRAAKLCGMEISENEDAIRNILAEFLDYKTVSDWAKSGVAFCFENNFTDRSVMNIEPHLAVKRCEIAQIIYNLLKGARLV